MDVLDGRIARWRHEASPLGQELDSLADVVSFGVAPATMGFAVGLQGGWDALCLVYFVGCGISRLARYNATAAQLSDARGKVTHFEGMPIPSSLLVAMILAALAAAGRWGDALPFSVVPPRTSDAAPAVAALRAPRQRDDQQDAAHPEAVSAGA